MYCSIVLPNNGLTFLYSSLEKACSNFFLSSGWVTEGRDLFSGSNIFVTDSIIEVEHVNARDWKLNNYITSGYVSGDTIIFTEIRTVQTPWLKPEKIFEKYIYDSSLTTDPLW